MTSRKKAWIIFLLFWWLVAIVWIVLWIIGAICLAIKDHVDSIERVWFSDERRE